MQNSDVDGIHRRGKQGRTAGMGYFDNPMLRDASLPVKTPEQLLAWCELGNARAAGWLEEDAGRDESIAKLMGVRYW